MFNLTGGGVLSGGDGLGKGDGVPSREEAELGEPWDDGDAVVVAVLEDVCLYRL